MHRIGYYHATCEEVSRLLRQEWERRKLTKYAVAQLSGVSQAMLGYIEKGTRIPSLEVLLRIADGIGADLPALIKKAQRNVEQLEGKSAKRKTAN